METIHVYGLHIFNYKVLETPKYGKTHDLWELEDKSITEHISIDCCVNLHEIAHLYNLIYSHDS